MPVNVPGTTQRARSGRNQVRRSGPLRFPPPHSDICTYCRPSARVDHDSTRTRLDLLILLVLLVLLVTKKKKTTTS